MYNRLSYGLGCCMKKKLTNSEKTNISRAYSLLTTLALNLVIIIVSMFFIGVYLDKKFGTSPIFLFVFLLLGLGASFRNLYVLSLRSMPKQKKKYEYKGEELEKDE